MTEPTQEAATLAERLKEARVDLLTYIEDGIPERAWLPASKWFLARGGRHHISAPMKSGKSLGFLVHAVNIVSDGGRVAILDRENGAEEYARRLRDILEDRTPETREALRTRFLYYAWPEVRLEDGPSIAVELAKADLVIFDSTRTFTASLGLGEDGSDDYALFSEKLILPLFQAGVATVQLDNTGHEGTRARGTSVKGDLADVVFLVKTVTAFDQGRRGTIEIRRKHSRFGDVAAAFTMNVGAGHYGRFATTGDEDAEAPATFRPTGYMERVSKYLESQFDGQTKNEVVSGVTGKATYVRDALDVLVSEGYVDRSTDGQSTFHKSLKPFREATESPSPDRVPTESGLGHSDTESPSPLPRGTRDPDAVGGTLVQLPTESRAEEVA